MAQTLKKNALLEACITNNSDIFEVIKAQRKAAPSVSSMIDGVHTNIESHFASTYKELYNSLDDKNELRKVKQSLNDRVTSSSIDDLRPVTPSIVEEAIKHLKSNKNDPIFEFSSECLKNAPVVLCEHLALLFRHYLKHGHISSTLMLSTLIPLIKDKLGDITSSNNYRSIALSSLILKVFDWVVLLLHRDNLKIDELQFGFQQDTSTTMCTWLAVETIDYFLRNGSDVFVCVMDMTKAFDKVQHSKLFWKLVEKGVPPIFIRLLLVMYNKQLANVRWNGVLSDSFFVRNGVKQGAVLSPILYCIYIDSLFTHLRKKKTGCWVNGTYVGIVAYADDLMLLSPTLDGLQEMTKTCEDYANTHNLSFSTNPIIKKCKTKCLAFLKKERNLSNIKLNGMELPWVDTAKHLGCRFGPKNHGLLRDLMEKRALYINKVNELNQEFHYAHPLSKVKINKFFNTHFYGSQLWNLFSEEANRLEKTWNISQRIMLGVPRNTHRYFIEPLTETQHIIFSLQKRFIKFIDSIKSSTKLVLRNMLEIIKHDCRSTTGRNVRQIMLLLDKGNINEVSNNDFKKQTYNDIPSGQEWKVCLAKELIQIKNNELVTESLNRTEVDEILNHILTY